ncbi:MAG: hypothetical protein JO144_01810, partial [Actinobacteria bacterium]|nr:hypothetical protein [Actinomycetota bacterium]
YPEQAAAQAKPYDDASLQTVLSAAEHDSEVVNLLLAMNWGIAPAGKLTSMRLAAAVAKSRRTDKRDARREARVERKGTRIERRQERKQRRAG